MISGRNARKLPNTSARISQRPDRADHRLGHDPGALRLRRAVLSAAATPVSPACHPAGSAAVIQRRRIAGATSGPPNPVTGVVYTSANVLRPSLVTNARSPVARVIRHPHVRAARRIAPNTRPAWAATAGSVTRWPGATVSTAT